MKSRKPWPMRWIVLLILLFIVPYTYLTLHYRRPGPGYEPYRDGQELRRVAQAGYRRLTLSALQSDERQPPWGGAAVAPAPGGWPEELRQALFQAPLLPRSIGAVHAPFSVAPGAVFEIEFACTLADDRERLSGAQLYLKDGRAVIVPEFERLSEGLSARSRDCVVAVRIPPGAFAAGDYAVLLLGQSASKTWTLQVH